MNKIALIINADDFGYDCNVNRAILASFSKGLCSSTTIMPNMPGFEEACEICYENDLTENVGLHLVLTEGIPLTNHIKKCSRFCDKNGRFICNKKHLFRLSYTEKDAVSQEICAQIDRCRKYGIPITHIDSHQHIHTEWGIIGGLAQIAKNKKVRYIRLIRNCGPNISMMKRIYKWCFNTRLRLAALAATKYFGRIEDLLYLKNNVKQDSGIGSFEVLIHPYFDQNQVLKDKRMKESLEQCVAKINGYKDAISFSQIAHL